MVRATADVGSQRRVTPRRNRDIEIVEAAVEVFSRKGFAAASLQDVADRVGLLKGSLYHYIDSKEGMLFRILQETHQQAEAIMAEVDQLNLPARERLLTYVERIALWYLANLDRAILYLSEWRYLEGDYAETVRTQRRAFHAYMRDIVDEAYEAGQTRPDLDVRLATSFVISAIGSIPTWYRAGRPENSLQIAQEVARLSGSTIFGVTPG